MKIVIVGPGAIGSLFAAFLAKGGHDVGILDHNEERARKIADSGIRSEDGSVEFTVPVHATSRPALLAPAPFIFICVKAYDTLQAARDVAPLVTGDTLVVSVQNGLGNAEAIGSVIPDTSLLCATTAQASILIAVGHVRHTGSGPTILSPIHANTFDPARELANRLSKCGLETRGAADCRKTLWSKLVINAAVNPLTAIHKVKNGILIEDAALRSRMSTAAREAAAVARAHGISLDFDDEVLQVERVCRATADNESSMLRDVQGLRRTEIEQITGMIVASAAEVGIPVPVNAELLDQVRAIEKLDGVRK
ncbi:MAG: 2-dehydropantoate 2-reductase [Lentisphaerae bacterium]|nr:2-dehydropantoate 2-reductase [Lentisphaerota bacterium]